MKVKQGKKIVVEGPCQVNYKDKEHNNLIITINGLVIESSEPVIFTIRRDNKQICKYSAKVTTTPTRKQI